MRGDLFIRSMLVNYGVPYQILSPLMRILSLFVAAVLLCSCSSRQAQTGQTSDSAAEVNTPLTSFSQDITSSVKSLELRPSGTTLVPVTLHNPGPAVWASAGRYPVNISYKWFDGEKMLPIEGERTFLAHPIKPGDSADAQVKIVAPPSGSDLVVKITLVQEGVQWFMIAGAKPLELPVTLR